ncbi:hypothetical protein [Nocardia sp. NPDC051463]|uniref:hypothetical protein n=1 Tax=Nocardia sp. NPDC051463 TaxID=3154845 RepID=UPI003436F81E
MRAKPNRSLTILLAGLATVGSMALSGAAAAAARQQDPTPAPECTVGQTQEQGPYLCECGPDGKWVCLERGH